MCFVAGWPTLSSLVRGCLLQQVAAREHTALTATLCQVATYALQTAPQALSNVCAHAFNCARHGLLACSTASCKLGSRVWRSTSRFGACARWQPLSFSNAGGASATDRRLHTTASSLPQSSAVIRGTCCATSIRARQTSLMLQQVCTTPHTQCAALMLGALFAARTCFRPIAHQ